MSILTAITAISGNYPDIAAYQNKIFLKKFIYINRHFFPIGEPISPHLLRSSPIAVEDRGFMGRRLASAAISTRE